MAPSDHRDGLRQATISLLFTFLLIEFVDELVFGVEQAAWPLIRDDLVLSYAQIGLLFTLPKVISLGIDLPLGILSDTWRRRVLLLGGGVLFVASVALTAGANTFAALLLAFVLFYPASGAFVSLSQAALMDADPARREQNMARWTFAGSLGVTAGPLLLGLLVWLGPGWRGAFLLCAMISLVLLLLAWRAPISDRSEQPLSALPAALRTGFSELWRALQRLAVLRWLALLEFADFMLDVLLGFMALYLVDGAHFTVTQAGIAVAVWTVAGLLGDFLIIPLLERVRGLDYLRVVVTLKLLIYPAFLLVPGWWPKLALLALMGLINAGWYAILQAQLYGELPEQSGLAAISLTGISGVAGSVFPLGIGLLADQIGIAPAMWVLLAGPLIVLLGLPRGGGVREIDL